jgi:hypothetical protein
MIKKIISILFIAILLVVCVLGYISIKKQGTAEHYNVFGYVGNNAAIHIRINNPMQLSTSDSENSEFLNLIYGNDKFIALLVTNLIPDIADTNFVIRRNSIYVLSSAFVNEDRLLDFVHFIPVRKDADVKKILSNIATETTDTVNISNDISCYQIDKTKFYVYEFDNIIAVSSVFYALKSNIQQVRNKQTLADDALFTDGLRSAGRYVDANVFVNSSQLPQIVNALLGESISDTDSDFMKNIARWFILDADVTKNLCHLSGFIYTNSSNFLHLLKSQQKSELKILKELSPETLVAYSMQASNIDSLLNEYNNFFSNAENQYFDKLTQMSDSLYVDVVQLIKSLYPEEIALSYNPAHGWITLIKIISSQNAYNELQNLEKINHFADIVPQVFGKIFGLNKGKEISITDNFIVISKNKINNLKNSGILSINSDYIIDESLVAFYANPGGISQFFNVPKKKSKDVLKNIFIEIITADNRFYLNSNILLDSPSAQSKSQNTAKNTKTTAVETETTKTQSKSANVILKKNIENDADKQKYTIFQYADNTIELKDARAKSLWTKSIDEKIGSDIFVINPFNKGTAYLLFNTENKIYLIDFRGKIMSGFPIALPAAATNSVSIFAYDKTADYRIFIACANKKIYLYNTNGQHVNGWRIPRTEGIVQRPILFLRMDARDYLIAVDNSKIYVLNRKGYMRTNVKEKVQIPVTTEFEKLYNPARLRVKDKSERQLTINLINGKVTRK